MNLWAINIFFIFVVYSFIKIYNKSYIQGFVYLILFIYTYFTMLGYNLYPEYLNIVSKGQYYGEKIFWSYYVYIFLSFITFYFFIRLLYRPGSSKKLIKVTFENKSRSKVLNELLFFLISIIWLFILAFYLIKNYTALSYYNQYILKSNKIWFYLYSAIGVLIFSILAKLHENVNFLNRLIYKIMLIIISIVFIITSLKAGQRIQLFCVALSFIAYFVIRNNLKIRIGNLIKFQRMSIIVILFMFISQIIRTTRGRIESLSEINLNFDLFFSLIDTKNIIFQDYLLPSLSLMTSMNRNIIFPLEVIKSNVINATIIFDYPSLGETLSRIVDPNGVQGFGYYYLTEGYNLIGFSGFLFSSVTIVIIYCIYENLLTKTNNKTFNLSISSIIVYYIINIVRGGSLFFIKGIFFYIIPFIILYLVATNKKIKLYYFKKHTGSILNRAY